MCLKQIGSTLYLCKRKARVGDPARQGIVLAGVLGRGSHGVSTPGMLCEQTTEKKERLRYVEPGAMEEVERNFCVFRRTDKKKMRRLKSDIQNQADVTHVRTSQVF